VSGRPRILILGAAGQVGQELKRSFADTGDIIACSRTSADLASPDQLRAMVRNTAPDVILNAAAYTAVDRAESEPKLAMAVNALAPGILAEEALRAGALLVHYSTDYVFDGTKTGPWEETDVPNPLNVYGASKLAGEDEIRRVGGRYLIFRTSWVYGPHGKNFLLTMLRLGRERDSLDIVDDQIGTPTSSIELADVTRDIISGILEGRFGSTNSWTGLYHMTCGGSVSWCGFAQAIFTRAQALLGGKIPSVNPIPSSKYPAAARRPQYSALSNEKLYARFSIRLAPWESALDAVIRGLTVPEKHP
jgi:dTDP-4-dehydrorhamnose reductase